MNFIPLTPEQIEAIMRSAYPKDRPTPRERLKAAIKARVTAGHHFIASSWVSTNTVHEALTELGISATLHVSKEGISYTPSSPNE